MTEAAFSRQNVGDVMFAGLAMPPVVVTLPWPDKALSPNARVHWSRKAKATKAARSDAFYATREALGATKPKWEAVRLSITFNPPDKRRRDADNLVSSLKAACDGMADALGVNDYHFVVNHAIGTPVKGGAVRVEIRPL